MGMPSKSAAGVRRSWRFSSTPRIPAGTFPRIAAWADSVVLAVLGRAAEAAVQEAGPSNLSVQSLHHRRDARDGRPRVRADTWRGRATGIRGPRAGGHSTRRAVIGPTRNTRRRNVGGQERHGQEHGGDRGERQRIRRADTGRKLARSRETSNAPIAPMPVPITARVSPSRIIGPSTCLASRPWRCGCRFRGFAA